MNHRAVVPLATLLAAPLLAPPLAAQNLLTNAGFDDDVAGWTTGAAPTSVTGEWSPLDVAGDPQSGSAAVTNTFGPDQGLGGFGIGQCAPVTPGAAYDVGAFAYLPSDREGITQVLVHFFATPDCSGGFIDGEGTDFATGPPGEWLLVQRRDLIAPPTANSGRVFLLVNKEGGGGSRTVLFDDARFCPSGTCALQLGDTLESAEVPGFRFRVTIETGSGAVPAVMEPVCLAETLCVSGALPGRVEAQLRVIGPRPNGFLWFQVVRFTPSRLVVEAEQLSTGEVKHYVLEAIGPGDRPTSLEDRFAFLP